MNASCQLKALSADTWMEQALIVSKEIAPPRCDRLQQKFFDRRCSTILLYRGRNPLSL
jgi:hypothetical protein